MRKWKWNNYLTWYLQWFEDQVTDILDSILSVVKPLYWLEIQHYHYQHLPTVVFILCVIFLNFRIVFIVAILGHSELAFFAVRAWINMAGKMVIMGVNRNNGSPKEMDWKKASGQKLRPKQNILWKKHQKWLILLWIMVQH